MDGTVGPSYRARDAPARSHDLHPLHAPKRPEDMRGTWRRYYERWASITRAALEPAYFDLIPELAALVPPGRVVDKRTYSPWLIPGLEQLLGAEGADTLIISGAETDVCVLAAVLGAVDLGYRVILPETPFALRPIIPTTHCLRSTANVMGNR